MFASPLPHLILLHLINLMIFDEDCNVLSCLLCNFLHPPVTSCLLGPKKAFKCWGACLVVHERQKYRVLQKYVNNNQCKLSRLVQNDVTLLSELAFCLQIIGLCCISYTFHIFLQRAGVLGLHLISSSFHSVMGVAPVL
jgi:hypothetical protein